MAQDDFLPQLIGSWKGTCQTWFQPGVLADTAEVVGRFESLLGTHMLRHTYEGTLQGERRVGEAWLAHNPVTGQYQESWVDNHHMSVAVMFSVGQAADQTLGVLGQYDAPEGPPWSWRTTYELGDPNHLTITAYNIPPGGDPAKAIELQYERTPD
ncbi:MAG: DUF1579 family protein [Planctomycetota bacterium]